MDLNSLTPKLLVSLPLEKRGVEILRAVTAGEGRELIQHRENILRSLEQNVWGQHEWEAARAYEEAFDWIERNGFVSREPSQSSAGWFYVTDRGWQVVKSDSALPKLEAAERLAVDLHPAIAERVRTLFIIGEVENAVFTAMKAVEVRVRELGQAPDDLLGVRLMQSAFADAGALADPSQDPGERQATMALFWGAIGVFKNPSSHREVDFTDLTFASEAILFADLLLRILDRIESRLGESAD